MAGFRRMLSGARSALAGLAFGWVSTSFGWSPDALRAGATACLAPLSVAIRRFRATSSESREACQSQ